MRYLALIAILILFTFAMMNGCQNNAETPVQSTPTPAPEKPVSIEQTDYSALEAELNQTLDRLEAPALEKAYIQKRIQEVSKKIENCDKNPKTHNCSKPMISNLHLMIGDLYFSLPNYESAVDHFQSSILNRFDSFEDDQKKLQDAMAINGNEQKKQGKTPQLQAGAAFLEATYSFKAFKDYAEMVRAEKRLSETYEKMKNDQEAKNAKERARLGLAKAIEFRISFDKSRQTLLSLVEKLGPEYQSYKQYVANWDNDIKIKKI